MMPARLALLGSAALAALIVIVAVDAVPARADETWLTSYAKALEAARASNKVVLADFTGSDWCPWCIKLKAEVFDTPEFKQWADQNVVLLEVDFPRGKAQPDELKKQNRELAERLGVEGFPTVVFLDGQGEEVGQTGYLPGGPAGWIREAQAVLDSARPKLRLRASLSAGLAEAKTEGLPLLLAAAGPAGEKLVQELLADGRFIRYANLRLAVVQVKSSPESPADAKALADFKKQFALPEAPLLLAAIDPAKGKLLYSSAAAVENIGQTLRTTVLFLY